MRWEGLFVAALVSLSACVGLAGEPAAAPAKPVPAPPPLRFGIYPGGAAGTVGPAAAPKPEEPADRLAALEQLRGRHQLVLHLYASYTGPGGWSTAQQLGQEVAGYGRAGFEVELALCYRPADRGSARDVAGFAQFVRDTVSTLGRERHVVSIQVTNEANVGGAPNASDGYYTGAKDALLAGVIAAKHQARAEGSSWLKVGFNWADETDRGEPSFWTYLRVHGGSAFERAVDWVGIDAYPGTWGPPLDSSRLGRGTADAMLSAIHTVRTRYMAMAHLPGRVAIHISENGYPTGPDRTAAMQTTVMHAAITAIEALRGRYGVTDYRWFDLRDADSASRSFEDQYGLMYDDYRPKPAFAAYRELIARYGMR